MAGGQPGAGCHHSGMGKGRCACCPISGVQYPVRNKPILHAEPRSLFHVCAKVGAR